MDDKKDDKRETVGLKVEPRAVTSVSKWLYCVIKGLVIGGVTHHPLLLPCMLGDTPVDCLVAAQDEADGSKSVYPVAILMNDDLSSQLRDRDGNPPQEGLSDEEKKQAFKELDETFKRKGKNRGR